MIVKLESSMHRYGDGIGLVEHAQHAGLRTVGVAIHPPLAGSEDDHRADIVSKLPDIDPSLDVWVSHLAPATYAALPRSHQYKLRAGTYLWLGDREALHLEADVLDTRPVMAGAKVGYRLTTVDVDGTLVMIGAGSANGVTTLPGENGPGDTSPFHYAQTRMTLVEPPHMS